jgi:hypothetical protein
MGFGGRVNVSKKLAETLAPLLLGIDLGHQHNQSGGTVLKNTSISFLLNFP